MLERTPPESRDGYRLKEDLSLDYDDKSASGWVELTDIETGWVYRLTFTKSVLTGFALSAPMGETVTARNVRDAHIGRLEGAARALISALWRMEVPGIQASPQLRIADELAAAAADGRWRQSDVYLALLARFYVDRSLLSNSAGKDLAAELGLDVADLYERLRAAKRRELFVSGPKGKSGGQLTEKAVATLRKAGMGQ